MSEELQDHPMVKFIHMRDKQNRLRATVAYRFLHPDIIRYGVVVVPEHSVNNASYKGARGIARDRCLNNRMKLRSWKDYQGERLYTTPIDVIKEQGIEMIGSFPEHLFREKVNQAKDLISTIQ